MLEFREKLLENLIKARFGSIDNLIAEWEVRAEAGEFKDEPRPPNRASLFRWTDEKPTLPRKEFWLWRLCALLDADPFCLLRLSKGAERKSFEHLYSAFATNAWPQGLNFLGSFFGLQKAWPPPAQIERFFGRKWFVRDFFHDGRECNYFARIALHGDRPATDLPPQVYHFAYSSLGRWTQYGIVLRGETSIELIQVNGQMVLKTLDSSSALSVVETWFGQQACEFRIASIHPFFVKLGRDAGLDARAVRFSG